MNSVSHRSVTRVWTVVVSRFVGSGFVFQLACLWNRQWSLTPFIIFVFRTFGTFCLNFVDPFGVLCFPIAFLKLFDHGCWCGDAGLLRHQNCLFAVVGTWIDDLDYFLSMPVVAKADLSYDRYMNARHSIEYALPVYNSSIKLSWRIRTSRTSDDVAWQWTSEGASKIIDWLIDWLYHSSHPWWETSTSRCRM
jgi:hypothetical protein